MLADRLAQAQGWRAQQIPTSMFKLQAYRPPSFRLGEDLWVYIEGDGLAWAAPSQPSLDPTPSDPLALRLALAHPQGNVAYLARPCQYTRETSPGCSPRFWTGARFSPEVIDAGAQALDVLKHESGARQLTLVGYSGGAAVGLLMAARRSDVARVITVAGNLDTRAWALYHRISPLAESLNPADDIARMTTFQQWHLVGDQDDIVPPFLAIDFVARFAEERRPVVQIEPGFDHRMGWVEQWSSLIDKLMTGH